MTRSSIIRFCITALAVSLLAGCYDYWTEASIRITAGESRYPEVIDRITHILTARGYNEVQSPVNRTQQQRPPSTENGGVRAYSLVLKPNESAGVYIETDEPHRAIKLKFMQLATHHFSDPAVQEYRGLVNTLKGEFSPNRVTADTQTRRGQVLWSDSQ